MVFVLVVVGKAAEIRKQLEKYGTWTVKKITDQDFQNTKCLGGNGSSALR